MPKSMAKTSQRLLDTGLAMMSREGLSGVTLGRLADDVGMSKSGVFAHFRSKVDVQIALLEHTSKLAGPRVLEPAMREPPGLRRLHAFIEGWFGWAPRAGLPGGCPIAAAMFELDDVEGPVREKVLTMEREMRGMMGMLVSEAIATGELRADTDVEQIVWELCGIYLGHHVASRFVRDPKADARGRVAVQALLERARS
jgi:AcrR family transcriptional regulator